MFPENILGPQAVLREVTVGESYCSMPIRPHLDYILQRDISIVITTQKNTTSVERGSQTALCEGQ